VRCQVAMSERYCAVGTSFGATDRSTTSSLDPLFPPVCLQLEPERLVIAPQPGLEIPRRSDCKSPDAIGAQPEREAINCAFKTNV
jgi:hypothetical protein